MFTDTITDTLKDFSLAGGVSCEPLYIAKGDNGTLCANYCAGLCDIVKRHAHRAIDCHKARLYGVYQSEAFGGKYIYYCPLGFVNFTSPITQNGKLIAAAIAGPLLMIPRDEFLDGDIKPRVHLPADALNEVAAALEKVPVIAPTRVTALSNTLRVVCSHISEQAGYAGTVNDDSESDSSEIHKYLNHIQTMGGAESSGYPLHIEQKLLSCITAGDVNGARKLLNELLSHIYLTCAGDFNKFKARILELVVLLSRAAVEGGAEPEEIFGMNYRYLSEIHIYTNMHQLNEWLCGILKRFTDCIFNMKDVKHVDVIYKAVNYIKANYAKQLTLDEIAKVVYLSPTYFSKIFNNEIGENFNSYLNKIRVQQSKKLLMEGVMNLTQIAVEVGFADQSYFTKVFKRVTGVSPGKYRELRGNA